MEISKTEIEINPLWKKFVDEWNTRFDIQKVVFGWMDGDSNITFPVFPEREEAGVEPDDLEVNEMSSVINNE